MLKLQCASCLEPTVAGVHHDCWEVIAALRDQLERAYHDLGQRTEALVLKEAEVKRLREAIAITPEELSKNSGMTYIQAVSALERIRRRAGRE